MEIVWWKRARNRFWCLPRGRASLQEPFSWIRDLMPKQLAEIEHYDKTSCIPLGMGIFQRFPALNPAVLFSLGWLKCDCASVTVFLHCWCRLGSWVKTAWVDWLGLLKCQVNCFMQICRRHGVVVVQHVHRGSGLGWQELHQHWKQHVCICGQQVGKI